MHVKPAQQTKADLPKQKVACTSFCLLYLCNFGFVLLLCSLQGFKVVSGTVVIHKLPSSLRYTRLRKMEKRVVRIFPSSQKHKASQKMRPPLHPTSRAPHGLPKQGHSLILHTGCPERWPWEPPETNTILEGTPQESRLSQGKQTDPTNNSPTSGWH